MRQRAKRLAGHVEDVFLLFLGIKCFRDAKGMRSGNIALAAFMCIGSVSTGGGGQFRARSAVLGTVRISR
jgi:hypothetical protein